MKGERNTKMGKLHPVERKFLKAIEDFRLLENKENSKILIGFSGGPDSSLLVHLFHRFKNLLKVKEILLVHINHLIRATAFRDEEFCRKFSELYNLPLIVKRVDVREISRKEKLTLEEAGRKIRYKIFREILREKGLDFIATAHHSDDLIETQILYYVRSANWESLKGFNPKEEQIIRPLFYLTKREIYEYLKEKNIPFVEDETNLDTTIPRNLIRNIVIPHLRKLNPSLEKNALKLNQLINEELQFWKEHIEKLKTEILLDEFSIDLEKFQKLSRAEKRRFLKEWLPLPVGFGKMNEILNFIEKPQSYGVYKLSKDFYIVKNKNLLLWGNEENLKEKGINLEEDVSEISNRFQFFYVLNPNEEVFIQPAGIVVSLKEKIIQPSDLKNKPPNIEYFQIEKPWENFIIRNRRRGDRFIPFGWKKSIKLKDFFIKEKIPAWLRDRIPLLIYKNEILAILGIKEEPKVLRRSSLYPVRDFSQTVLELKVYLP